MLQAGSKRSWNLRICIITLVENSRRRRRFRRALKGPSLNSPRNRGSLGELRSVQDRKRGDGFSQLSGWPKSFGKPRNWRTGRNSTQMALLRHGTYINFPFLALGPFVGPGDGSPFFYPSRGSSLECFRQRTRTSFYQEREKGEKKKEKETLHRGKWTQDTALSEEWNCGSCRVRLRLTARLNLHRFSRAAHNCTISLWKLQKNSPCLCSKLAN